MNLNKVYYPEVIKTVDYSTSAEQVKAGTDLYTPVVIPEVSYPQPVMANELINQSLNTLSRQITGTFTFNQVGALQIGTYQSGVSGDLRLSPNGIVARNSSGATTFALDGVTGSATFLGTLKVGSVIEAGALIVGTNVGLGTAQDSAGVTTIVGNVITTGYVNALNVNAKTVSSDWVYAGNISANQINTGTLTGVTITSSGGTNKIVLNNGDTVDFYSGGNLTGQMRGGQASGIIANVGSFITYRQQGFFSGTVTSGAVSDFFKFFCSDVSGVGISGVIEAPTGDRIFITKADGNTLLSTSNTQTYSLRRFVTDADNMGFANGKQLTMYRSLNLDAGNPGFGNSQRLVMENSSELWVKDNWRYAFGNGHIYASDNGGNFNQIV